MHAAPSLASLPRVPAPPAGEDSPVSPSVRRAGHDDVPALVRLINEAYLVERFFVDGDRTDDEEIAALAAVGHFLVLDRRDQPGLAAAVYVRLDGAAGYLGMLSVAPELRSHGLGRRLVGVAEALCTALGATAIDLQIVNLREELGPWYRSQGYEEVGIAPFPADARDLKRSCHFIKMRKSLEAPVGS